MGHQGRAIGIDLGTTYSCVAIWQNGKAEVIANDQGNRTTPSMVAFTAQERLIGEGAKHQIALNPKNTVFDVKRLIGRRFCEASVQRDMELWPFQVVPDDVGNPLIEVQYKGEKIRFPPQQISAMVLEKMKTTAEEYLNTSVRNAVITVPAYFNDAQRKATRDAGTVAGLNVTRIINEPSAAAIAYGFRPDCYAGTDPKTILVFDLGGGTFDVSIVSLCMGRLQVKGVGGDMHLGGEDFDNNLLDFCVAQFQRRNENAASSSDITANARALRRLRSECERAKRTLSAAVETVIDIDALHDGCDFRLRITRSKFEELNEKLFLQCINIVEGCLRDASMKTEDVDEVVLVGGSARIPRIQQLLEEFLPGIPLSRTLNFDEAVAMGAAIQAASLANEGVQVELSDVVRLSLGVSINGGEMNFVVPRNTPLPTVKEKRYTTRFDGQSEVCFPLYEGERPLVADNNLLAEFKLTGIPPKPAGVPDIKVTFSVDEDATVTVSAKDEICGMAKQMVISHDCGRLSEAEIERMIADAEHFRSEDEEARRRLVARNSLDALIHNLRRRLLASAAQGHMTARDAERMQALLGSSEDWLDDHENASAEQLQELLRSVRSACRPLLQIPPERLITFP